MSVGSNQDACNPVRTEIGDAVFLVAPSEFDWFKHCEAAKGLLSLVHWSRQVGEVAPESQN